MKCTAPRAALITACQLVQAATPGVTTKPILNLVKLIAADDSLTVQATDLEVGIRYEIRGVKVKQPGAGLLDPGKLIRILKESADETVLLDATDSKTSIVLSDSRSSLPGGDPDEFPDLPAFDDGGHYHEITAGVLRTMIKRTAFAAEKRENTRYAVTGVLWEAADGKAKLVATDTKRLAITEGPAEIHGTPDEKVHSHLIPLKAITLLERNLTDDGERIRVSLKTNDALFQTERATIHTRLVEGKFPPYQQFIPMKYAHRIVVSIDEFASKISRASVTSRAAEVDSDGRKTVFGRIDFHFEPGKLTLQASGPETGSSEVEMALPDYDGKEFNIAFDPAYLLDYLRSFRGEPSVTLQITSDCDRMLCTAVESSKYLVVPMVG